jgi:hypothetical protein
MPSWAAANYELVSITAVDSTGLRKSVDIRVAAGASDANIQTLIAKMQAQSDASLSAYTRHKPFIDSDAADPSPYDPAVNPLNLLSTALQLDYTCGPSKQPTRISVVAPASSDLVKGSFDKARLDPTSTSFTDLQTAGINVLTNTAGQAPIAIQTSVVETRKSRNLAGPS